ncbi:hypothetical protein LINPERPRIM_LOCUS32551 [Linum perenne]
MPRPKVHRWRWDNVLLPWQERQRLLLSDRP